MIAVLAPGVQDSGSLVSSAATHQPINHLFPPRAALTARLCCSVPHLQATLLFFGAGGYFACYYFCHVRVLVCLQCPLSLPCEFTFRGSIFLIRSSLACKTQDRRFSVRRFQATRVSHKADFIPSSLCERGQRTGACLVWSSAWVCLSGRGQASGQSEHRMTSSLHRTHLFPSSD